MSWLLQRTRLHHQGKEQGDHGIILYSKACWKCDSSKNRGEESEAHDCPKNFEGSSKSMETFAILKMVKDAFYNRFFIIYVIVRNDDSTMCVVLKHPSKGARGQVIKSSKGKLDTEIPDPSLISDPSHCVRFVAKHIFSIVNKSRDQRCWCIKADALLIKKYWGNMIKNNREKQLNSWVMELSPPSNTCLTVMKIVVQNGASRHEHQKKGNTYNDKDEELRCEQNSNQLHNLLKKTLSPFQIDKVLKSHCIFFTHTKTNQRKMW